MVVAEITLHGLLIGKAVDPADFLARADVLGRLGLDVLISRFELYYQLGEYLAAATDHLIGIAVGLPGLIEIARDKYYERLPGGILEATGRLFRRSVKMYVYPTRDPQSGAIIDIATAQMPRTWTHFRDLLLETGHLVPIAEYRGDYLTIAAPDVLAKIDVRDASWEALVPPAAADAIKSDRLFGYVPPT